MTVIKLASALPKNALPSMLPIELWNSLGQHRMALVEFVVSERTEAADEDSELSAKIAVVLVEFAHDKDDEHVLREAMRARYAARTANGTLTEGQEHDLSAATLALHGSLAEAVGPGGTVTITSSDNKHTATIKGKAKE